MTARPGTGGLQDPLERRVWAVPLPVGGAGKVVRLVQRADASNKPLAPGSAISTPCQPICRMRNRAAVVVR